MMSDRPLFFKKHFRHNLFIIVYQSVINKQKWPGFFVQKFCKSNSIQNLKTNQLDKSGLL